MKILNKNNGITLIALVITIIVMLILVAVSISMAVNGGLFNHAGKAVRDTQNAIDAEKELANGRIQVDGVWYDSLQDVANKKPSANQGTGTTAVHSWTRGTGEKVDKFTCSHCNKTYTMGEEVGLGTTTLGTTEYDESKLISNIARSVEEKRNVTGEEVTWVVLGIEDTDKDGINETLLLTSSEPVKLYEVTEEEKTRVASSEPETFKVYMKGAAAYNNGPEEVERVCKEIYSNTYGEARSMKIEDVNSALQFTPLGGMYYNNTTSTYSTTGNLTTKLKNLPEETWNKIKEAGTYTPDGANTEATLGEYELNGYAYGLADDTHLTNMVNDTLTEITAIEKEVIFGANKEKSYWLASRGVRVDEYSSNAYAFCGPGRVVEGIAFSFDYVFNSYGGVRDVELALRPVVSLKSELPGVTP